MNISRCLKEHLKNFTEILLAASNIPMKQVFSI